MSPSSLSVFFQKADAALRCRSFWIFIVSVAFGISCPFALGDPASRKAAGVAALCFGIAFMIVAIADAKWITRVFAIGTGVALLIGIVITRGFCLLAVWLVPGFVLTLGAPPRGHLPGSESIPAFASPSFA